MIRNLLQTQISRAVAIAVAGVALAWPVLAPFVEEGSQAPAQSTPPEGRFSNAPPHPGDGRGARTGHRAGPHAASTSAALSPEPGSWGVSGAWPERRRVAVPVDPIETRLGDPDPEIRIDAVYETYGLAREAAVPLLQKVLITEKDGVVADVATEVLTYIAGDDAVRAVTTGLGEDDVERRLEAVAAMSRVGQPAVPLLGQVLFGDPDPALRLSAVETLSEIASPAAMALLESVSGEGETAVGLAAGDAVAAWGGEGQEADEYLLAAEYPDVEEGVHALLHDLSPDRPLERRIDAVRGLYGLEEEQAVAVLAQVLRRDGDVTVREEALFTLEQMGSDAAARTIELALGDASPAMRHHALSAISMSQSPSRRLLLAQVLYADPDPAVRREAARLLGEDPDPAARLLLQPALGDADPGVRVEAERLMAR